MDADEQAEAERQDAPRRALETLREHHATLGYWLRELERHASGDPICGGRRGHEVATQIEECAAEVATYGRRYAEAVDALEEG